MRDEEHEGRGTCVALVMRDGKHVACGLPVVSRGKEAQACDGHLRAPTVLTGDIKKEGIRKFWRYCVSHGAFQPLKKFLGFCAHCTDHEAGKSVRGRKPSVPAQIDGEELVVQKRDKCSTLSFGETPRSTRRGLEYCDVSGCGSLVQGATGFCGKHRQVRYGPLDIITFLGLHALSPLLTCTTCVGDGIPEGLRIQSPDRRLTLNYTI